MNKKIQSLIAKQVDVILEIRIDIDNAQKDLNKAKKREETLIDAIELLETIQEIKIVAELTDKLVETTQEKKSSHNLISEYQRELIEVQNKLIADIGKVASTPQASKIEDANMELSSIAEIDEDENYIPF